MNKSFILGLFLLVSGLAACTIQGCEADYNPDSGHGCDDKILGFNHTDINTRMCISDCSPEPEGLGNCENRLVGGSACTVNCLERQKGVLRVDLLDPDSDAFDDFDENVLTSTKLGVVNSIPSCGAGEIQLLIPYPIFCDTSLPVYEIGGEQTSSKEVGPCTLNFTDTNPKAGDPMPVVPGVGATRDQVSFTIYDEDITYKKLTPDGVWSEQPTAEGEWYSVISSTGGKPILFPGTNSSGTVYLISKLTAHTEIGDPVVYNSPILTVNWERSKDCGKTAYCRPTYNNSCGGDNTCDTSSYRCRLVEEGELDIRLFETEDAAKCSTDAIRNINPTDWVYHGHEGFPGACHGACDDCTSLDSVNPYCDKSTEKCESRFYGYNPPNPLDESTHPLLLHSCTDYVVGITQNGGSTTQYNAYDFMQNGNGINCETADCNITVSSTYHDYYSTTTVGDDEVFGEKRQIIVPGLSFTTYGLSPSGVITVNLTQGDKQLTGSARFEVLEGVKCEEGGPCMSDNDCGRDVDCGLGADSSDDETYCDLDSHTCECVCNNNGVCNERDYASETTLSCPTDCCVGPLNKATGLCDHHCGFMEDAEGDDDDWCDGKEPGWRDRLVGVDGEKTTDSMCERGRSFCRRTCGDGVCDNGEWGTVDFGENYTRCPEDCCARDDETGTLLPYTIDSNGNPVCVEACLNASTGFTPTEVEAARKCLGMTPGTGSCDVKCGYEEPVTDCSFEGVCGLEPVLFTTDEYEDECEHCSITSSDECMASDFMTGTGTDLNRLRACSRYWIGFKLSQFVDCSGGCNLTVNDEVREVSDKEVVCIEYSDMSFIGHEYNNNPYGDSADYAVNLQTFCTEYAVCQDAPSKVIVGKTEDLESGERNKEVSVSLDNSISLTGLREFKVKACETSECLCDSEGDHCLEDGDCGMDGMLPMFCVNNTCQNLCGNGVCNSFEKDSTCPEDCCAHDEMGDMLPYNVSGYCSYPWCGGHERCDGYLPGSDIRIGDDVFSCDNQCLTDDDSDSINLRVFVQECSDSGDCDESSEREFNSSSDGSVTLVKEQDDLLLDFSLGKEIESYPGYWEEEELWEDEIVDLSTGLFVEGSLYAPEPGDENPVNSSSAGGWYVKASELSVGSHEFRVESGHPSLVDAVLSFPVQISRLQSAEVLVSDQEGGDVMDCFYRKIPGSQDCGLGTAWVKVVSEDQESGDVLNGTAVCEYALEGEEASFSTQLGVWNQVNVTPMQPGFKRIRCEVWAENYILAEPSSTFLVKGLIGNVTVEVPEEITPGRSITFEVKEVFDEFGKRVLSPNFVWFMDNYPVQGETTQFCESLDCPRGLPLDVPVGEQSLVLSVSKKGSGNVKIYDERFFFFPVQIKEAVLYSLSLIPKSRFVPTSGGVAGFAVSVANNGNKLLNVSLGLDAGGELLNWTSFSPVSSDVLPGDLWREDIDFRVPASQEVNYSFSVNASESYQGLRKSISGRIRVTDAEIVNFSVNPSESLDFEMFSNRTEGRRFLVYNTGSVNDTYSLSVQGSGAGVASLNQSSLSVPAGGVGGVGLVFSGDEPGLHEFRVCAVSSLSKSMELCSGGLVNVIPEEVMIRVPENVSVVKGGSAVVNVSLLGSGDGLVLLSGGSVLESWLPWSSRNVSLPSDLSFSFQPDRIGVFNLTVSMVLGSGVSHSGMVPVVVSSSDLVGGLNEKLSRVDEITGSVDEQLSSLRSRGVRALQAEALMEDIGSKRERVDSLIESGELKEANGLASELVNLAERAEEYSELSASLAVERRGPNVLLGLLGMLFLFGGIIGVYVLLIRPRFVESQVSAAKKSGKSGYPSNKYKSRGYYPLYRQGYARRRVRGRKR